MYRRMAPPLRFVRKRFLMICLAVLCLLPPPSAVAEQDELWPKGELVSDGKYEIWQQGFFRIKFLREGESAPPPEDVNHNGCPDYVDDVAAQLMAAHHIFCRIIGFRAPLDSPRYKGVRWIDVLIRDREGMRGRNGLAADEISRRPQAVMNGALASLIPLPKVPVLRIALNRDLVIKKRSVPSHEYFHQIQNGMTHFKNRWFYEGMAVWAQGLLHGKSKKNVLANSPIRALELLTGEVGERQDLFNSSYEAAQTLWEPLARLCVQADMSIGADDPVLKLVYTDGSPVVKKTSLTGAHLMRRILENSGELESKPFDRFAYGRWTEENQRNPENNAFLVEATVKAVDEICPRNRPAAGK